MSLLLIVVFCKAEIFLTHGLVLAKLQSKCSQAPKKGDVEMQGWKAVVSGRVCARAGAGLCIWLILN